MDGVQVNFRKGVADNILAASNEAENKYPQSRQGFFVLLEPMPGAIESVKALQEIYDVWILTRPSFYNLHCYTEKAIWVKHHLGYEMQKKLILCGDKSLVKGDFLIDDMTMDGQDRFDGELVLFGSDKYPDWKAVMKYMSMPKNWQ